MPMLTPPTYLAAYDQDAFALSPLQKLVSHLDTVVPDLRYDAKPGAKVALKSLLRRDVVEKARAVHSAYAPLADVAERQRHHKLELEATESVRNETWIVTFEMSHLIKAGCSRKPELLEELKPRIGSTPDDRVANLKDMRHRLDRFATLLTEKGVKIQLLPQHSAANVAKQVEADKTAAAEYKRILETAGREERQRVELRGQATALHPELNTALLALGLPRDELLTFGLEERTFESARARSPVAEKPVEEKPTPPGPIAAGTPPAAAPKEATLPPAAEDDLPPPTVKTAP